MEGLFSLLFTVCCIALIIGLINPNIVVRWGIKEKKTRKNVLKYYGIGMLLCAVLTGALAGSSGQDMEPDKGSMPGITAGKVADDTADIDKSAAIAVDSEIEALGDIKSITLERSDAVRAVREAYDSLDSQQKSYVENLSTLSWAEEKLVSLQAEAEKEAAIQAQVQAEQELQKLEEQRAAAERQVQAEGEAAQAQNSETVYITKTGEKYHRDGCQYLRQSKIPISKSDAVSHYEPCSRCNP